MLQDLEDIYIDLLQEENTGLEDGQRLLFILEDLNWYSRRIGQARWDELPRSNKWSFEQNLWRLTRQAEKGVASVPDRIRYFIDTGKECVGRVSEIYALFEYRALEEKMEDEESA